MLAKRIIPCLDVKDGRVVKGTQFIDLKDAGDPVENAKAYDEQGADEIAFLDITASHEKREILIDIVRRTAEEIFIPLTVGGGVRNLEDIRKLLKAGADKVSINTAAVKDPSFVEEGVHAFRKPVHCHRHRCQEKRARLGSLHAWRKGSDRDRCPPLGQGDGEVGGRRDPPDQYGPGWDKGWLRHRIDPDHFGERGYSCHRFRWRRDTGASLRGACLGESECCPCGFYLSLPGIYDRSGQIISERKRSHGPTLTISEFGLRIGISELNSAFRNLQSAIKR